MNFDLKCQVLGADRYDYNDSRRGRVYAVGYEPSNEPDKMGLIPMNLSSEYELLDIFKGSTFPVDISAKCEMRPAKDGAQRIHILSADLVKGNTSKPTT